MAALSIDTDIIQRARDLLLDPSVGTAGVDSRWTDAELTRYANDAQQEIAKRAPHAVLGSDVLLSTAITDTFVLELPWRDAVVSYVVARAMSKDAAHADAALIGVHDGRFKEALATL